MAYEINPDALVEKAEALQEELDVLAFVDNSVLPEDEVTVYTNAQAALRIHRVLEAEKERAEQQESEGLALTDEFEDELMSDEEFNKLHEQLVASGLVFKLRGLAPKAVEAIEKEMRAKHPFKAGEDNMDYALAVNTTIVAKSIKAVVNVNGQTRTRPWTAEEIEELTKGLFLSEQNKLYTKALELSYISDIFDSSVTADFS